MRMALGDIRIGTNSVAEGDATMLLLAAAHRDPAEYYQPNIIYDAGRKTLRH